MAGSDLAGRAALAGLLAEQGYDIEQASTGEQALALIRRGGIDLLVAAMVMNGMDGLELLQALRRAAIDLPAIVIASGNGAIDEVYLKAATLLGAARTHLQPLQLAAFLDDARTLTNFFAG